MAALPVEAKLLGQRAGQTRGLWQLRLSSVHQHNLTYAGSTSSFVPHGYSYVGQRVVGPGTSSSQHLSKVQKPSTGYVANLSLADLKSRPKDQQQRSADKEHETVLFTSEGHIYTKP